MPLTSPSAPLKTPSDRGDFQGKLEEYIRRKYQYREFVDPNRNAPLTVNATLCSL